MSFFGFNLTWRKNKDWYYGGEGIVSKLSARLYNKSLIMHSNTLIGKLVQFNYIKGTLYCFESNKI